MLPGNVSAFYTGSIYARASGYITAWYKDIGAHVKKGDTLAVIAAPDLDQQLAEAKAQLVQLQAAVQQAQANRVARPRNGPADVASRRSGLDQRATGRYGPA